MQTQPAPSSEAKLTAVQVRDVLRQAQEAAIENHWEEVINQAIALIELAQHLVVLENGYVGKGN